MYIFIPLFNQKYMIIKSNIKLQRKPKTSGRRITLAAFKKMQLRRRIEVLAYINPIRFKGRVKIADTKWSNEIYFTII